MRISLTFIFFFLLHATALPQQIDWQQIDKGLEVAFIPAPRPSDVGDSKLTVVRVHPAWWDFRLLCASAGDGQSHTAKQWAEQEGLTAVVNAGMFRMDGLTNVGYMRCDSHVNNGTFNADRAAIAFQPKWPKMPEVTIIDRDTEEFEKVAGQYGSVTQGIRMIDTEQRNRWSQQPKRWSMVVFAMDRSGRVLLIFTRSPYSVHDFIDMLLELPLEVYNAMYLEGGPEASLYLKTKDCEIERFGSYETGFYESDGNDRAWPVPNVIGVVRSGQ